MLSWSTIRRFSTPRYWLHWFGFALLRFFSKLPIRWQVGIGMGFGFCLYPFFHQRRRIARINMRLCYPDIGEQEVKKLLRRHFLAMGAGFIEVGMSWWSNRQTLKATIKIEGEDYLRETIKQGKGAILLCAHFTTVEIGFGLLKIACPDLEFRPMYQPHKNPLVDYMIQSNRERILGKVLSRSDARGAIKSLRQNKAVAYAPDQNVPVRKGEFVNFFGQSACTNTATPRLAKISGAPVIPFSCKRLADNKTYLIKMLPPLTDFPSDNLIADLEKIHHVFEEQIRQNPEQYFWVHKRFKTRPKGLPSIYPK